MPDLHVFLSQPNPQGFKVYKTAGIQAPKIDLISEETQPSQKFSFSVDNEFLLRYCFGESIGF